MPQNTLEERRAYQRAWYHAHKQQRRQGRTQRNRAYYAANKERLDAANRVYREQHKAEILAQKKAKYDALTPEEIHKKNAESRQRNLAHVRAREKAYRTQRLDKLRPDRRRTHPRDIPKDIPSNTKEYYRALYKRYPEEMKAKVAKRDAAKRGAMISDLTAAQWKSIKEAYGYRCVYCSRKMARLTQDHIVPLSKGGNHTVQNVVPACQSCNSRKGTKGPLIPVQPLLFA